MARLITCKDERLFVNGHEMKYELSHTIGLNSAIAIRNMNTTENSFNVNDSKFYVTTENVKLNKTLTEGLFSKCHQFVYTEQEGLIREVLIFNNSESCDIEKCIIELMNQTLSRWNQII